jgi:hypothetical protein
VFKVKLSDLLYINLHPGKPLFRSVPGHIDPEVIILDKFILPCVRQNTGYINTGGNVRTSVCGISIEIILEYVNRFGITQAEINRAVDSLKKTIIDRDNLNKIPQGLGNGIPRGNYVYGSRNLCLHDRTIIPDAGNSPEFKIFIGMDSVNLVSLDIDVIQRISLDIDLPRIILLEFAGYPVTIIQIDGIIFLGMDGSIEGKPKATV